MKVIHDNDAKVIIQLLEELQSYISNNNCEDIDIEINEKTKPWVRQILKENRNRNDIIQTLLQKKEITLQKTQVIQHFIDTLKQNEHIEEQKSLSEQWEEMLQ